MPRCGELGCGIQPPAASSAGGGTCHRCCAPACLHGPRWNQAHKAKCFIFQYLGLLLQMSVENPSLLAIACCLVRAFLLLQRTEIKSPFTPFTANLPSGLLLL